VLGSLIREVAETAAETDELRAEIAEGWDDDLADDEGTYVLLIWRCPAGQPATMVHRSIHGTVERAARVGASFARHLSIRIRDWTADPDSLATLESRLLADRGDSFCDHPSHRAWVRSGLRVVFLDCQIWCRCPTSLHRGGER
jgi:hypothetical protein